MTPRPERPLLVQIGVAVFWTGFWIGLILLGLVLADLTMQGLYHWLTTGAW